VSEGLGVEGMTRGVPGVWYCCDMARIALKEWKGDSVRRVVRPR